MDLADAVRARLVADTGVLVIVSEPKRVRWGRRAQGDPLPGIVLRQVSRTRDDPLEGEGEPIESRVDIDCYAASHTEAWALANAAGAAVKDEADVDGFLFWNADLEGPIDLGDDGAPGEYVHRAVLTVVFRHSADT